MLEGNPSRVGEQTAWRLLHLSLGQHIYPLMQPDPGDSDLEALLTAPSPPRPVRTSGSAPGKLDALPFRRTPSQDEAMRQVTREVSA